MKKRKTISDKTFGNRLDDQEWKPSSTQRKDREESYKKPKKLGSMTKAERQKKHNDKVAKEIVNFKK